ncbi:MAG: AAA family ATPase [Lachnospiraceae bacterium]|nr:AAA family ATPase [Lachnospiraceae bacterium]
MKIIKLIFENINSYEGEVTIDFTDPGFQKGNNQFVVCGPMGSGKSTILDAITLALYGSTARLGRLTTSSSDASNELINKHSGSCRAEVVYRCTKGLFASSFELHKARDKVDGKVQTPQCALYEMTGDERVRNLLDSTSTDALKKKTEQIIGLSYDQFVRCILIPQGEFDRFLNSAERDKAAILAKLSHTEHYKEAARILNEKAFSLSQEHTLLKKERDAITVMSEEDKKKCEEEKKECQKQIDELDVKIEKLMKKINWLEQLKKAENDFENAGRSLNEIREVSEEYKLKTEELDRAKKSADCAPDYRNFKSCIDEQENIEKQLKEAEEELKGYASQKGEAEKESKRCAEEYTEKKEEKEKQKDIWVKVRSLDTEISVALTDQKAKQDALEKAEKNYKDKKADHDRLTAGLNETAISIKELTEYLDNHKPDENLEVMLAAFDEKVMAWKEADKNRKQAEKDLTQNRGEQERLLNALNDLIKKKDETAKQLHELVSSKYLLVAGILRQNLKPGSLCPVCGKKFAPAADEDTKEQHTHWNTDIEAERHQVANDISDLNDAFEEIKEEINKTKDELSKAEYKAETAVQNAEHQKAAVTGLSGQLNTLLKPWNAQVDEQTSEEGFEKIGEELRKRKDAYNKKREDRDKLERESEKAKEKLNGIDLKKLQEERDTSENIFNSAELKYRELAKKRRELFGGQSVDDVEKAFDDEISKKEKKKETAENDLQAIVNKYNETKTKIDGYKTRSAELDHKQSELKKSYLEKLRKDGFSSEEEFLGAQRSEQDMADLNKAIDDYKDKKTRAQTTYENTQNALDKLRAEELTTESLEELNVEKTKLEENRNSSNQKLGGLKEKLDRDNKNKKAWEEADAKLQKLGAVAETYSRINEMLGKKDGSDFEVFVQGIAMRSLLEKANVYLESIIPQYHLVQRSENSVDFIVKETMGDLTVITREVSNFSGGEKFIISLSLALAMAEFAGQNGDVECIFLDEGFGTLSGEPLLDAINALKRLSSTGKMLGIITHIEAVIQAFNKIEAKKIGEKSRLYGPGVTYSDRNIGK